MSLLNFNPIIQDTVQSTLRATLAQAERQTMDLLRLRRQMCLDFYHNEVLMEDGGKDEYLKNFFGYRGKNGIWKYKSKLMLEHLPLTEQLIDLKARNYKEQPDRNVDGELAENYQKLLKASGWHTLSKRIEQYTQLLNDIAIGIFYDEKTQLLKFILITDYYPIFDYEDTVQIDPVAIVYPTAERNVNDYSVVYAYYDDEKYVKLTKDGQVLSEEENTYKTFNFIFPHRKRPTLGHFSSPRIPLVLANQNIDIAMSSLNQLLHYNGHKQMVIVGRVSTGEGNEQGNEKSAAEDFALGNGIAIQLDPQTGDTEKPSVSMVDMQAKFTEAVDTIKFKFEAAAQAVNVSFQWEIQGGPQSGFSLQVQNIRDTEDRQTQEEILEEFVEMPLYQKVTEIAKVFKFKYPVEEGELSIDFIEPEAVTQVKDEIELEKHDIELGIITPIDLILRRNPDIERDKAERIYEENKAWKEKNKPEALQDPNQQDPNQSNQQQGVMADANINNGNQNQP